MDKLCHETMDRKTLRRIKGKVMDSIRKDRRIEEAWNLLKGRPINCIRTFCISMKRSGIGISKAAFSIRRKGRQGKYFAGNIGKS
jgi:hypothetical protein